MKEIKNDEYYANKIIDNLKFIVEHMSDIGFEEFSNNEILQDSMMFRLIQISENAKRLTDEYKELNTQIPWKSLSGIRNKIVHEYGNVDYYIVFNTLKNDVLKVLEILEENDY